MRLTMCCEKTDVLKSVLDRLDEGLRCRSISYSVRCFHTQRDVLYDIEDGHHPDVLLLEVTSASYAETFIERLRVMGYTGRVVLLSTSNAFAVDGYEWGADAYWVLPIQPLKAATCLERMLGKRQTACLTVRYRSTMLRIPYTEIVYIESRNARCVIRCENGKEYTVYTRLKLLEEQLCDERFLRCHQSFLVNMDYVAAFQGAFVMMDGSVVSVRQRELRRFRELYFSYISKRDLTTAEMQTV